MIRTRSTRVLWLIKEMGIDFELKIIDLMKGEHKSEEFLKINPNGTIPALVDGDFTLFESFAIIQHLLEKYESSLLPSDPVGRSSFFQYSFWTATTLDPCVIQTTLQLILSPNQRNNLIIENNKSIFHDTIVPILENLLGDRDYLLGKFSALDVVVGFTLQIADQNLNWLEEHPKLHSYIKNLYKRESFIDSFEMK